MVQFVLAILGRDLILISRAYATVFYILFYEKLFQKLPEPTLTTRSDATHLVIKPMHFAKEKKETS